MYKRKQFEKRKNRRGIEIVIQTSPNSKKQSDYVYCTKHPLVYYNKKKFKQCFTCFKEQQALKEKNHESK